MKAKITTKGRLNTQYMYIPNEVLDKLKDSGFASYNEEYRYWEIVAPTDKAYNALIKKYKV